MRKIKLLIFQYSPVYLDPEANIKKMDKLLRDHSHTGCDVAIFPEHALTNLPDGHHSIAFDENDSFFDHLRHLAQKYKLHLIPGSFLRRIDNKIFNSTCLISPEGKILDWYEKKVMWGKREKRSTLPGNRSGILETPFGKIGLQICADIKSAELASLYQESGVDVIINIALWSKEDDQEEYIKKVPHGFESSRPEILGKARSVESGCYFIFCNYAGKHSIHYTSKKNFVIHSIGSSMVINPFGQIIASADTAGEEVLAVTIDLDRCHPAP